jgi:hypothetical protein
LVNGISHERVPLFHIFLVSFLTPQQARQRTCCPHLQQFRHPVQAHGRFLAQLLKIAFAAEFQACLSSECQTPDNSNRNFLSMVSIAASQAEPSRKDMVTRDPFKHALHPLSSCGWPVRPEWLRYTLRVTPEAS